MPATDRLESEQLFHDRQARERAATFRAHPETLAFSDPCYLDHESWIRPAFARLGAVAGKAILDFGCGHGMAAVVLARLGARVTAFDLSRGYLREAQHRARANGVSIHFLQADGETLPFADGSFDAIWGNAILHHLDLHRAGRELYRVLRPGGVAVFCEPWGENPLLRWARRSLPYPGKGHTADEHPLRSPQLALLRAVFPSLRVDSYQFLSMVRRVVPSRRLIRMLDLGDRLLLAGFPWLRRWCRYVVLTLPRPLS